MMKRPSPAAEPARKPAGAPLSLKQRLLWWLMLPLLAAVPAGSFALYGVMRGTAVAWLDQALGDTALAVANFIRVRDGKPVVEVSMQTDRALRFDRVDRVYYEVLDPQGRTLVGDAMLGGVPMRVRAGEWRFLDAQPEAETLRMVVLGVACGPGAVCQVRVAETVFKRDALRKQLLLTATGMMVVLAAVLAIAGRLAIQQGLRPLDELKSEVEERQLDRLEPLSQNVPAEVQPLIAAINRLFERLRLAALAQQDFLANAAHQLRTPLTSLRTDIDLALLEPHDAAQEPLLKRLQKSVDRSARLAQQMLAMARADATVSEEGRPLDLRDLAAQVAEDWVPRAVEAGLDLGFDLQAAPVLGQGFLLRELLENLIHNCLSYAGPGARVTVRTASEAGWAVLEVEDNGPGIPASQRARALERFQRGAAARGLGSGLGLAIALDIARRHGGALSLHDGTQGAGLLVRVELPLRA